MDTASLFNDLATRLTDADAKAILREQIDAGIIADKGQEWFDANKAMLDADWENALAELGFTDAIVERGGAGSGHHGHEGRPGERGGSAPGEGGEKPRKGRNTPTPKPGGVDGPPASLQVGRVRAIPAKQEAQLVGAETALMADLPREEYGDVVAADGTVLLKQTSGATDYIRFSDEQMESFRAAPGAIMTHNHPLGSSISDADILFVGTGRLAEVRAVGKNVLGEVSLYRARLGPEAQRLADLAVDQADPEHDIYPAMTEAGRELLERVNEPDARVHAEWGAAIQELPQEMKEAAVWYANSYHRHEVMRRVATEHPELLAFYSREVLQP